MTNYVFKEVSLDNFGTYYTIYCDSNIFMRFDWLERINGFPKNLDFYFVSCNNSLIGGFSLNENTIGNTFIVSPFEDKITFWNEIIKYSSNLFYKKDLFFENIETLDSLILQKEFSCDLVLSEKRMLRPTSHMDFNIPDTFVLSIPTEKDIDAIAELVFNAHSRGYTSNFVKPNIDSIKNSISSRIQWFKETNSLHLSCLLRTKTGEVVGVCLSGIYPDSPSNFSTINQVSVSPDFRRMGIASQMIQYTISEAVSISPVITLGVMDGNPAEILYKKLGFKSGPCYHKLLLKNKTQPPL